MLISPVPRAHVSVLFILTVCAVSAAFTSIYKLQPAASASTSRETSAARPAIETSAPALVSATIVVNSTADTINTSDGLCTLPEAIAAANTDTASGPTVGECAAGSGSDTIDITGVTGTITLTAALPAIATDMTLSGPGANLITVARDSAGGTPEFRVFTINSGVTASITGLTIANGKLTGTNNGGGILNDGALTLTSCDLYGNSVDQSGGAINSNGTSLTINDCQIGGLSAGQPNISGSTGAGIYNTAGVLSITGGSVVGNSNGGGVFVAGGSATLNGTRVTNNSDFGGGGGVTNLNATTTVVNSLIAANSAANGAGVYNQNGTMTVANSTISGNTSSGAGGGARNQSGTLILSNVTVTNNRTTNAGLSSGGISVSDTVHLRNTIVAGNFRGASPSTTAGDITGAVSFGNSLHNLIGTCSSCGLVNGLNGNRVGVLNPGLGLLANNGGLTETHALLVGSLALDGGNNTFVTNPPFSGSAPFLDQRGAGFKRILDAADADTTQMVDIGAYEANPMIANIPNTFVNEDASITCLVYNVGDETEGFSSIVATSSNQSLVQDANLNPTLPNASGSRCLAIGLEPNQFGSSTIAVTLTGNNGLVISDSFLLTVNAIGDAPSVTSATTDEDTQTSSGLVITKNPSDGSEVTQFYITNIQNGTLYQNNGVTQIFNNSFITLAEGGAGLKFTPAANLNGAGSSFGFTVQAASSAGFSSVGPGTNASITVNPVNDPPSFTKGSDVFVNQQSGGYTIPNWATNISAGAPNESGQVLTFEVTGNTNSALFSVQPAINSAGTLTFTGAANTTGTSTITVHLKDNGGGTDTSPPQTFSITISAPPATPVVNTVGDAADNNIGDRVCDSDPASGDQCTLRAALQETNATGAASGNGITFSLPSPSTINLASALPDINTTLTVTGPGASSLTVQRGSGAPNFRIFSIGGPSLVVSISGLTIANGNLTGTTFPTSYGAGIYAQGTLTLTNVTLSGNNAGASGGAILNDGGSLTLNSCLLTNNVSGLSGGGLANRGNATVNQTTFSSNSAAGSGGGISNSTGDTQTAVLTVTNSTFFNNSSQSGGGGVFNIGTATLTNVTISSNSASAGGGISNANPITLNNVTIANNSAANAGGGMYNPGIGAASINNSILAANTSPSGPDCSCANLSGDYNLYGNTSGVSVPGTHNVTNAAALLGPLADNGGPTKTHALLVGSPAIDAGNSAQTTDQRGTPRPVDDPTVTNAASSNATDMGAYESHNLEVNTVIDADDGSCTLLVTGNGCTLREAINAANVQTGAEAISFAAALTSGGPATISLSSALPNLSSSMTINGPGSGLLTVRRNTGGDYRIFRILSGTVGISGLTVTNGKTPDGVPGNFGTSAENGGGILNSGTLTLTDVNLTGNRTGVGGAGLNFGGSGGYGGALANTGTVTMTNCSVTGNITGNGGAGNAGVGDGGRGGGIYNENNLTMTNCAVNGNTTGDPGTAAGAGGKGGEGGGIYSRLGVLTLTNVTVNNNVTGSTPPGNASSSIGGGGGIFTNLGLATLTNCTISGNQTGTSSNGERGYGGGINNESPMTIISTTISGNTGNSGSAILNRRGLTLTNTTVSGNHGPGTVTSSDSTSSLTLINSTIAANDSVGVVGGGTSATARNTIIAGNGASGDADVSGTFTSQGNNLIGVNGSGMFGSSGFTHGVNNDQVGSSANPLNARLAALANNGGPTLTHALLAGSPALDTGNNCVFDNSCSPALASALTLDQRGTGFSRKADSADADTTATVDIGAFEAQASVEDISDKATAENTPLSFGFNVGHASAITNVTASSNNTTLVPNAPANLNVTGTGSTRTLNITPAANQFGVATITVTVTSGSESMLDTFVLTVTPGSAGTPTVTPATTNEDTQTSSGLVISRNAADGAEVTHFKITNITKGTLFKNNGVTQINNGDIITFAEGNAGLKFTPAGNLFSPATAFSFNVQGATDGSGGGLSPVAMASITVNPVAEAVSVTGATTTVNTQTTSGLVITKNAVDGAEVTHFKITNITNGTLFKNNGVTQITNNSFITVAEGGAGLRFTPANNLVNPSAIFRFQVQGATSSGGAGLGPATTATVTVSCGSTIVTNTNNSGAGSLRQAILSACPGSTITFAAGLTSGGPATIILTTGELLIDKNLTVSGPGAHLLSVSGNNSSRIFNVQAGTVAIRALAIINGQVSNAVGGAGGGVINRAALTLINCAITDNTAGNSGGGLVNFADNAPATLTIINSTISGNSASSFGGGLHNTGNGGATVNLINSTVAANGNPSFGPSFGGGIYNSAATGTVTLNITNSTIGGNRAGTGGGIFNFGNNGAGTVNLNNSIVADNVAFFGGPSEGPDIFNHNSGNVSGSNNIIESSGGHTITTGSNNSNVDPLLEKDGTGTLVLKNNGGPTKTLLPAHNSPAINNGSNAALPADTFDLDGDANTAEKLPVDQRGPGFSRVVNTTVDIGAVEVNYTITVVAGSPQSAFINTAFATQLQARVQESGINRIGLAVTFTAPPSGASGSFSSSATVNTNSSGIATAPVFTANGTAGGPYNVVASLSGGSPSTNFALTNLKIPTTTVVSSSVSPSEFGQSVTFTATVTSNAGAPAGTVQFKDGGINLGSPQTLNAGGVATLTTSSLTSGTHTITAEYSGNAAWVESTATLPSGQLVKPPPTLTINDVTVTEGNTGTANLTFTVTLSAASNLTVSAGYTTADGSATSTDSDYQSTSGTVTFNPGNLSKTVTVLVNGDQKTEPDETVFIVLSNPVNAAFSDSQGMGTILNDDTLQLLLDTSGPDANQLAALDSFLFIRDPFRVRNTAEWFTSEQNTRVILFALNLQLNAGESPSLVKVTLLDGNGQPHEVAADDVRAIPDTAFTQVTFRLPDGLAQGTCLVTIKANERISNTGTFRIAP